MLKHLTDKEIITSMRKKNRGEGRDGYSYSLNDNFIKYHIVLNSFSNIHYKSYDETINERYSLRAKVTCETYDMTKDDDIFLD